jgi:uncharacterized protein
MELTTHQPGSFCTTILRTKNLKRAVEFYSTLLGWTAQEVKGSPGHVLLQWNGKTVAGIHHITDGSDVWVPHVSVENIERATEDALGFGAALVDKTEVPALARLVTLRDPEGALFGLWQSSPYPGAQLMDEVGSLWWIEVLSNNVARAKEFYGRLFGWTTVEKAFEPFERYIWFRRGDIHEGGILPIGPGWNVSPRWNSIFSVDDCDALLERATSLGGGTVFVHTVPNAGRIGSFCDLGGAVLVLRGPAKAGSSKMSGS